MSLKKILAAEGICRNSIDHGYDRPRSGGTDVMQVLVQDLRHEQGLGRTASVIPQRVGRRPRTSG